MAQFEFDASSVIEALQKADLFDDAASTELLKAGASHLTDTIQEEAGRSSYRLSEISDKAGPSSVRRDKNGTHYISVSVKGKNARGERLATIAFVLNYGRQKKYGLIAPSYFWTRAVQRAEKSIGRIYENIVNRILKERGISDA